MTSLVRYHGGKVRLAPKIVGLFRAHDCYVEPFGGGAAVLLEKPRTRLEIYNDRDGDMVALFRVLRDRGNELARAVALTPYAREELETAMGGGGADDLERARRVLVRSHMGHGGAGTIWRTGFSKDRNSGVVPCKTWLDLPEIVLDVADRMRGVVVENLPALDVIREHDSPSTLHYVDPPYLHETRGRHRYRNELSDADHVRLLASLRELRGAVVLSGYASAMYDAALHDWQRVEIKARADQAGARTEIIWMNFHSDLPLWSEMGAAE